VKATQAIGRARWSWRRPRVGAAFQHHEIRARQGECAFFLTFPIAADSMSTLPWLRRANLWREV